MYLGPLKMLSALVNILYLILSVFQYHYYLFHEQQYPIESVVHASFKISFLKIVLHAFAQNNDLVRIFHSVLFA